MIIWLIFSPFLQTKPSFCRLFAGPSWTFLPKYLLVCVHTVWGRGGGMGHDGESWRLVTQQADEPNDIGRNFLLGYRKKIAKFLMRTFTCRSTFLYLDGWFRGPWVRWRKTKILVSWTDSVSKSRRCIYVSFGNFPGNYCLTSVLKVILRSDHGSLDDFLIFFIQISELQIIDKSGL